MSCQYGGQQRARVELAAVVPFFVHRVRQLLDVELLQWLGQRHQCVNALEVSAGAFGVFTHPMTQLGGCHQGALGQNVLQRCGGRTAKIQRGWHQQQATFVAHAGTRMPNSRSKAQVRIKGRPIKLVGSSLSMRSSKAMPKPSLLALPAQS